MQKTMLRITFFSLVILFSIGSAQYSSEGPVKLVNGERYTSIIHFKIKNEYYVPNVKIKQSINEAIVLNEFPELKLLLKEEFQKLEVDLDKTILFRPYSKITYRRITENMDRIKNRLKRVFTLKTNKLVNLEKLISLLRANDVIEYCHGPVEFYSLDYPNDSLFTDGTQWELTEDYGVDAENMWSLSTGSSSIIIGLMEPSGYPDTSLSEIDSKVTKMSGSFSNGTHPTITASIAGAETNNITGMASINADGIIYAYTWEVDTLDIDELYVIGSAIEAAVIDGCHILNMSFKTIETKLASCGGSKFWLGKGDSKTPPLSYWKNKNFQYVEEGIEYAIDNDVICVASGGNPLQKYGKDNPCDTYPTDQWPAAYDGVIGVSASNEDKEFATDYNYGSHIDVNAPGIDVTALTTLGTYASYDGTSLSAPMTAGLIAVLLSEDPSLDYEEIIDIFQQTCDELQSETYPYPNGYNTHWGYGRINAYEAVMALLGDGSDPSTPTNFSLTSVLQGCCSYRPFLTWTKSPEVDVCGYEIYRKLNDGSWIKIATVDWDVEEYRDFMIIIYSSGNTETAYYKIRAIDREDRYSSYTSTLSINYGIDMKAGEQGPSVPDEFALLPSYPNPFNPSTTIKFTTPTESIVNLIIYDINGREIVKLVNQKLNAGYHHAIWSGKNGSGNQVSSGVYFYRIVANATDGSEQFIQTDKMMFVK